jgi:hypothetical protein
LVSKNWEAPESDAHPDGVLVLDARLVLVLDAGLVLVLDAGLVWAMDADLVWAMAMVKVLVVGSDVEWELDVHC